VPQTLDFIRESWIYGISFAKQITGVEPALNKAKTIDFAIYFCVYDKFHDKFLSNQLAAL